jgi:hypothetical protein
MRTTYIKVTGIQPDLKATLRSEAALKGLSLSKYFLDLALDGRIVQKQVRAREAKGMIAGRIAAPMRPFIVQPITRGRQKA